MKKIKYGNRRNEGGHKELQHLKEGDQICEGVLDTLSEDYLTYITHLVKHSKTPVKNGKDQEQHSSDSQAFPKPKPQRNAQPEQVVPHPAQHRVRHHSESGPKIRQQPLAHPNSTKAYPPVAARDLFSQKETIARDKNIAQKRKKKKMDVFQPDTAIQNEQKTVSFTRHMQPFLPKETDNELYLGNNSGNFKGGQTKVKEPRLKCYTNYPESEASNQKVSINDHMGSREGNSQRESLFYPFICEIDSYISHLESNPNAKTTHMESTSAKMRSSYSFSRKSKGKYEHQAQPVRRKRTYEYEESYSDHDVQQLLKDNLKLSKKVKNYEQKIDDLEDEISSHFIQCKNRDRYYKNKITEFLKALTQADAKMNQQKYQIKTMKGVLHGFGQKVRQIEHEQQDSDEFENELEDEDEDEDFSASILRDMAPQSREKQRTRHRRGLESTVPRHEEERRY